MIRSKLIKWLKWGLACCMLVPFLAWQAKDTSFQPTDTKGFYRRNAEAVCGGSDDKEERESQGRAGA